MPQIDPVTVEVLRNALIKAAEEMRIVVERTAYSTVIYEAVDFSCGIFDKESNLIAETSGIPVFLANLKFAVVATEETIGYDSIYPEDIIFCNDPYNGGGTHTPDVTCIYPIFYQDELLGFTCFKGHTLDMGGIYPGGWYNNTTSTFQEGFRIPPVKLYRRGKPNRDMFNLIKSNSRLPEPVIGDIRAMVAAVRTGGKRVVQLIDKYGKKTFFDGINLILDSSERIARAQVDAIPDGVYSDHFWVDGDGNDDAPLSGPLKISMIITVKGEEMTVDLTGSSPPSPGPMNVPKPTTISQVRYGFKCITTPFLPNNEGCFRPLKIIIPENTIFDPKIPSATCLLWSPSTSIPDLMLKVISHAPGMENKVRAGHLGEVLADFVYGIDPRNGRYYILAEPSPGGYGGKPFEDGESGTFCMADGDTYNTPAEVLEVKYPLLFYRYELIPDSGGPGKYRGGLGVYKEYIPVGHDAKVTTTFDRAKKSPPWGLYGGKDGRWNVVIVHKKDGRQAQHWKITDFDLLEDEIMSFQGGGGGGYGDPLERDPEHVREDILDGFITYPSAKEHYGVIIDQDTLEIDYEATKKFRAELRKR